MPEPDLAVLQAVLKVAEVAAKEAQSLSKRVTEPVWVNPSTLFPPTAPPSQTGR
jgi:hypothetical protein